MIWDHIFGPYLWRLIYWVFLNDFIVCEVFIIFSLLLGHLTSANMNDRFRRKMKSFGQMKIGLSRIVHVGLSLKVGPKIDF